MKNFDVFMVNLLVGKKTNAKHKESSKSVK